MRSAVNGDDAGSSPASGAKSKGKQMKKLLVFIVLCTACTACTACGLEPKIDIMPVETGIFDVVSSLDGNICDGSTSSMNIVEVVAIDKVDSKYTLSFYDDDTGRKLKLADSDDGYYFFGGISGPWPGTDCNTNITWSFAINYTGGGFIGKNVNRMTMGCASGSCTEKWDVEGTKR